MEKIRRLRVETGVSQKTLAVELKMSRPSYSNAENGRYIPRDIEDIKKKAINHLYPLLIDKIKKVREDLERLESMSLMFKSK